MIINKAGGIDLGTTNSVVAMLNETDTEIICYENKKRKKTIPSVVAFDQKNKKTIVGDAAFARRGTLPEPVVSIKRKMGTTEKITLGDQEMSPEQISSIILAECKRLMEAKLNDGKGELDNKYIMERAIITVPAYFSINAIEATKKAGELAGLYVEEILTEPTAAAIFYSWKHDIQDGNFLVYDLGGGTFDVSIVQKIADIPLVVGFAGNNYLGGDNFDREFARALIKMLEEGEEGYCLDLDVHNNPRDRVDFSKLVMEAECIKKELSKDEDVFWEKAGILQDKNGINVSISMDFKREEFENIIRELVESTIPECEKALSEAEQNAGITIEDIDYILLVGGSTKIPLVQEVVKERFCNKLAPHAKCEEPIQYEPDMAVAFGAAIRAASYGIKYLDDRKTVCADFKLMGSGLAGSVQVLDQKISLQGSRIKAANAEGTFAADAPINDDDSFEIKDLPVKENDVQSYNFSIIDKNGDVIVEFDLKGIQPPPPPLPSAAVLPNTVNIEIYNKEKDKVEMYPLIEKGTQLPAKAGHTFYTAAEDTKLKINLFENRTMLKETVIQFDKEVKAGTPIEFEIYVTENVIITAKGNVAGKDFEAIIEPPEIPVPTREYYEELKTKCDELISMHAPGDQIKFKMKKKNICMNIDEGFTDNEKQRIIEYVDKLKELIDELGVVDDIIDPDEINQLAYEAHKLLPKAREAAQKKGKICNVSEDTIQTAVKEGNDSASMKDKYKYKNALEKLGSIIRYLRDLMQGDTPPPPAWMIAAGGCQYVLEQIVKLEKEMSLSPKQKEDIETMSNQISDCMGRINPLMDEGDAEAIIVICRQIITQINKIIEDINKRNPKPIPPIPTPNF